MGLRVGPCSVGETVGPIVAVGLIDGGKDTVGLTVGDGVGDSVGRLVGGGVGECVRASHAVPK